MKETKKRRLLKGYTNYNPFYFPYFNEDSLRKLLKAKVVKLYVVKKDDIVWAVQVVYEYDHKSYGLFVGINQEGYNYGIPSFIDLGIINDLKNNGFHYFNMGGVPTDKTHLGIASFKKMFGARECSSSYGSTNFLLFPYTILNPLVTLLRRFSGSAALIFVKRNLGLE